MKNKKDWHKALKIAKKYGIKIKFTEKIESEGKWFRGKTILINPKEADAYTILHEIGHVLTGYMCCSEHCEYTAHGVAIGLAKVYGIRITKGQIDNGMDFFAGTTKRKECNTIQFKRFKKLYTKGTNIKELAQKFKLTQKETRKVIKSLSKSTKKERKQTLQRKQSKGL